MARKQTKKPSKEKQEEKKEPEEQEVELDEKTLEGLTESSEPTEANNFSEFMLSSSEEMPTATLSTSIIPEPELTETPQAPETLEEVGAEVSLPAPEATPSDYVTIYNEPDYAAGASEETILENVGERKTFLHTAEQVREMKPRVTMEEWHEIGEARERAGGREDIRDYVVTDIGRREETEKKLPFEQQRKYKELKRGK